MATITTINATDLVSASRAVINTNFANLNTDKVDGAAALTTAGRLVEVASSGVATQTSFAASVVLLSTGTYSDPAWLTGLATTKLTGTLQAAQFPALTGDITTSAGAVATTLANTAVTPASYGSATQVATFTVDSKGRLTAAASTSIAIAASQVTSGTLDNARTTAASTNTVSAIVARDASGNFAAGTITATFSGNLTGNVTGNASGTAATITGALALANTPLTTRGDLLVATTATPILGRLAKGTQYQVLLGGATDPTWGAVDLSQATAITGTLPVGNGGTGATTLAGAGIVAGAASITTANALLIGASAGVLGQSDATFDSGVISRAGTVGLSATGGNVVTLSTNSVERFRINGGGTMSLINASANPVFQMGDSLAGATRKEFTITVDTTNNRVEMVSVQQGVALRPIALNPTGGNVLIGTTTDDGSSKLQVAGIATANAGYFGKLDGSIASPQVVIQNLGGSGTAATFRAHSWSTYYADFGYSSAIDAAIINSVKNGAGGDIALRSNSVTLATLSSAGTLTLYNPTATTGVTQFVVRAGAGQSTTALQTWRTNGDVDFARVLIQGADDYRFTLLGATGGLLNATISDVAWVSAFGASSDLVIGSVGIERMRVFAADPGVRFATTTKIGFFGVTPVARAAALTAADATAINTGDAGSDTAISNMRTRIGELETKLQAYGLLN